jgi:hypothetical protein
VSDRVRVRFGDAKQDGQDEARGRGVVLARIVSA